jgi:hypothetical protein
LSVFFLSAADFQLAYRAADFGSGSHEEEFLEHRHAAEQQLFPLLGVVHVVTDDDGQEATEHPSSCAALFPEEEAVEGDFGSPEFLADGSDTEAHDLS